MHYSIIVYKFILIPTTVICITQQQQARLLEAVKIATDVFVNFKTMYENCFETAMPNLRNRQSVALISTTKHATPPELGGKWKTKVSLMGTEYLNTSFVTDDLNNYINEFSRTTVGLAPRFTSNRKFFLNMISHPKFKNLLAADTAAVQKSMVDKMKFCDESTLDMDVLKQLYDREVDQTRL